MSTYEEFMVLLTIGLLIVAILNYTHKKQRPSSGKVGRYFLTIAKRIGFIYRSTVLVNILYIPLTKLSNTRNNPICPY